MPLCSVGCQEKLHKEQMMQKYTIAEGGRYVLGRGDEPKGFKPC